MAECSTRAHLQQSQEHCCTYYIACTALLPQSGVRGYQKVEEYDPIERMKRLATGPAVSSLEQELKTMQVGGGGCSSSSSSDNAWPLAM
jgi:hypothetical protein